jgi:5'-nucleotidase
MKKQFFKVLIDMDNVLNQFSQAVKNNLTTLGLTYSDDIDNNYDMKPSINIPVDHPIQNPMRHILSQPGFWESIVPMPYAQEVVFDLYQSYDIWIATTPYYAKGYDTEICMREKKNWLRKFFPFLKEDKIYFEVEKWNLPGDVLIDDKPENLEKFKYTTVKFVHPYNTHVETDFQLKSWLDYYQL